MANENTEGQKKVPCGHTWDKKYENDAHTKHKCKVKIVPGVPHTGFHHCACGRVA